jgi:hypothetical protein
MPRQTRFSEQWLNQVDSNKHQLRSWCRKDEKDIFAAHCILCFKKIPCGNMGLRQVLQHATGSKHKEIACLRFSATEKHLVSLECPAMSNASTSSVLSSTIPRAPEAESFSAQSIKSSKPISSVTVAKSYVEQVTTSEVLWALKVVENDMPFSVCDGIKDLFKLMFPSDPIARDFTCGSNKVSYLITHGLAPYFKELLLQDIRKSNAGFTIHYDETTTSQIKKQMDIIVRFWSLERNKVVVHYLGSIFFGHAKAKTVTCALLDFLTENSLPLNRLLSLSSDGPNVNKSIGNQVNKILTDSHLPILVDIGSCNLHKVHNAFGRSLSVYGKDAEELALKLFYWFKHSAARREDFRGVQLDLELDDLFLLRHVPSRWLSL